jgi:hypothetical protein
VLEKALGTVARMMNRLIKNWRISNG